MAPPAVALVTVVRVGQAPAVPPVWWEEPGPAHPVAQVPAALLAVTPPTEPPLVGPPPMATTRPPAVVRVEAHLAQQVRVVKEALVDKVPWVAKVVPLRAAAARVAGQAA